MSMYWSSCLYMFFFFFFNDTATTEIYTLSLHDALPIWHDGFLVYIRALATTEEDHDTLETLMGTQGIKETTDFFLKKNDETDDSHAHQLVENGTQEAHLEHLTHKEPNEHKEIGRASCRERV